MRVNVKKTKIMISRENAGKVKREGFLVLFGIDSCSILSRFCRCWVHKRCSGIRGKLEEDTKFKCANQQTDIAEECLGIELNGQSLEIEEEFCYLGDIIGARGNAGTEVEIRSGSE